MIHVDPAVELGIELPARFKSPLNMEEVDLTLLLRSQSLRSSHGILDLGVDCKLRDLRHATRVTYLPAIKLAVG